MAAGFWLALCGFGISHYLTYYSPAAGNNLIIFGLFHIHHWLWALFMLSLLFCFLKANNPGIFGIGFLLALFLLALGHETQGHKLVGMLFWLSSVALSFAYLAAEQCVRRKLFRLLFWIMLGAMAEGICSGFYEGLALGDWTAFRIVLN